MVPVFIYVFETIIFLRGFSCVYNLRDILTDESYLAFPYWQNA